MTTNLDESITTAAAFQLKGGLYTLTTIQLLTDDLDALQEQINNKNTTSTKFL